MNINYMRSEIAKCYDGKRWKDRVAMMPENQVVAIYYKFQKDGRFQRLKGKKQYKQLTLWDEFPDVLNENIEINSFIERSK